MILPLLLLGAATASIGAKKPLDHNSFDSWKEAVNHSFSRNGRWCAFSVNPQEGDGLLTFYDTRSGKRIDIERGYRPAFTADGKWGVALIKPWFENTRQARIDKKKDFDLPQDSLALIDLASGKIQKIADVLSYRLGKEGGDWIAYLSCDTTYISPADLKDKKAGKPLVVRRLGQDVSRVVKWVDEYVVTENGDKVAFNTRKPAKDSISTDGIGVILIPDTSLCIVDRDRRHFGRPVFNREGTLLAYTTSDDSIETGTRRYELNISDIGKRDFTPRRMALDQALGANPDSLFINQYSIPEFSHDGRRLIVGVAPAIAPDDSTIVSFERADLDIWRWDAPYTPPQDLKNLEKARKRTFPVVTDLLRQTQVLVTDNPLAEVTPGNRWDSDWALVADPSEKIISQQWDYLAPIELNVKNVTDGMSRHVATATPENFALSPAGKYVAWFAGRQYHVYDIAEGTEKCVSEGIPYPLWDEDDDHPMERQPYGIMGWREEDAALYVYDSHDIWCLDPKGEKSPECLTDGYGRKNNMRLRRIQTDPEQREIKAGEDILLSVFDFKTKRNGLATAKCGRSAEPSLKILGEYTFTQVEKAKDAPVYSWTRGNFSILPDLWISRGTDFAKAAQVTDTYRQTEKYNWGTAQLVKWRAYDGKESEGVLYLPEDFSPEKQYPMLAVFYERSSERLYEHYKMQPSWSWVNYPFYVSRGYVVFVPDIHYTPGVPGDNAYNYVCSGVEEICRLYPNIDKKRIGIDGQSWGGYQTAYLVTRTDMFACAGSGAPVANMTSAYGGIRWGSGDSRQGQYEMGQSRIGHTLFDAPELYIYNSPVFHADRVTTPLLIMHNDNDGAVPWYQGIEMFMALRRLGKPVWMLQYNGEEHNLKERRNRKDITRRLQQFFDHYLKGDPMPRWMKEGIPMVRKGQEFGFCTD